MEQQHEPENIIKINYKQLYKNQVKLIKTAENNLQQNKIKLELLKKN
jgi:hypothetical protein